MAQSAPAIEERSSSHVEKMLRITEIINDMDMMYFGLKLPNSVGIETL